MSLNTNDHPWKGCEIKELPSGYVKIAIENGN
jgi:hypothetical protein